MLKTKRAIKSKLGNNRGWSMTSQEVQLSADTAHSKVARRVSKKGRTVDA